MAYSPLGRGFLTGKIKKVDDLAETDYRRLAPRFQSENLSRNVTLGEQLEHIAREKGCTPAQLALAWVLAKGEDIVPIPGTKSRARLEENAGAAAITLGPRDLERLDQVFPQGAAAGARYAEPAMKRVNL